jgi:hypothetical protein
LTGIFGPHGPLLDETQGLFISIVFLAHEVKRNNNAVIANSFFIKIFLEGFSSETSAEAVAGKYLKKFFQVRFFKIN